MVVAIVIIALVQSHLKLLAHVAAVVTIPWEKRWVVFFFFSFFFNLPSHILCRHPRWKRTEAGHGLHSRRILHGRNWQHDWWQHPGQLRERHRHHRQLPVGSSGWVLQFISLEAANLVCEWIIDFAIDLTANWVPSLQRLGTLHVGRELLMLIFDLTLTEVDSGHFFFFFF